MSFMMWKATYGVCNADLQFDVGKSLLPAGLTLKLAFFPDAVSATGKDANKQPKDETPL